MEELHSLPQIVSGRTPEADRAGDRAVRPPHRDRPSRSAVEEAELAKLFTNTWRYIKFAAANQLYMIATDYGADYERIRAAMTPGLPAGRRHARRRAGRRALPAEGHHAAGRVQQQQLHARPRQHDGERGPARVPGRPDREGARPLAT